ncbi:MAG TPA: hypothetical protein DEQ34_05520 [Balneolaceae bacterium]|nr:hypothetical protein [Balneolaceae bacterium]
MSMLLSLFMIPNLTTEICSAELFQYADVLECDLSQKNEVQEEEKMHQEIDTDIDSEIRVLWIKYDQELFDSYIKRCQTPPPDTHAA